MTPAPIPGHCLTACLPARAAVEPGIAHENLGQNTGQQKGICHRPAGAANMLGNKLEKLPLAMPRHDGLQTLLIEGVNGRQPLGYDFTVATVRAENLILRAKRHGAFHRSRLLTN